MMVFFLSKGFPVGESEQEKNISPRADKKKHMVTTCMGRIEETPENGWMEIIFK
jgi:hypothetical protein